MRAQRGLLLPEIGASGSPSCGGGTGGQPGEAGAQTGEIGETFNVAQPKLASHLSANRCRFNSHLHLRLGPELPGIDRPRVDSLKIEFCHREQST